MRLETSFSIVVVTMGLLGLGACAPSATEQTPSETAAPSSATGTVEVSNYPLAYVVERLGAPQLEVSFRGADAPDPAYWNPTADDVLAMQQADLIVVNGASYESWLKNVSLPISRMVDTTAGLGDRLVAVDETVTHSHGSEGEHEHTGTAFTTWLDPTLLMAQAQAVAESLGATWPEHRELFAERLAALEGDLTSLDTELEAATLGAADRPMVFSHPVYQYLQQRYGLSGESLHFEPDAAPTAAQWAELDHLAGHLGASIMIWESEPLAEIRQVLDERGLRVAVFDPCATPPEEGDFLVVMRRNAQALSAALAGSGG